MELFAKLDLIRCFYASQRLKMGVSSAEKYMKQSLSFVRVWVNRYKQCLSEKQFKLKVSQKPISELVNYLPKTS